MTSTHNRPRTPNVSDDEALVSKAMLNAAKRLKITNAELAEVIGISPSKLSRMGQETTSVSKVGKEFDLAIIFIRIFRSLDAITGGDGETSSAWIRNHNVALEGVPIENMKSLEGLIDVLHYLDSRRAII